MTWAGWIAGAGAGGKEIRRCPPRLSHLKLVIPDVIRDPTLLVRSEEEAGSRIKSGMTMEVARTGAWGCLPTSRGVGGRGRVGIGRSMVRRRRLPSANQRVRRACIVAIGGKLGDPARDLAPFILFMLSEGARYITEQIRSVNGGSNGTR